MALSDRSSSPLAVHLKYFQKYPNAGDQFSRQAAEHYFSQNLIPCNEDPTEEPNLLLLGSILEWADGRSYICGTGLLQPESQLRAAPKSINCVRGPLTALSLQRQGLEVPLCYGDPGILAPKIFPPEGSSRARIGIVPHYVDRTSPWLEFCRERGVIIIDPLSPLEAYFHDLQHCEVVLASSLHGIIFAHAYGKPALWIELSDGVLGNGFKFFDYYASIGVPADKVTRFRVAERTDPYEAAKLASLADHRELLASVEAAMDQTRSQLQKASP